MQAALPDAVEQIEKILASTNKIRQAVSPLLQNQKHLTAQQKERATELMFQADEMEQNVARMLKRFGLQLHDLDARANPRLRVMDVIHPPVTIRMPGFEADITEPIAGPVWIILRRQRSSAYIAIARNGRIVGSFPTRVITDHAMVAMRRLVGEAADHAS